MGRIHEIVFDCDKPAKLAAFWAGLLEGYAIRAYDDAEIARLSNRPLEYDAEDRAIAGAFVSVGYNGEIAVDSGLERGTVVTVTVPLEPAGASAAATPATPDPAMRTAYVGAAGDGPPDTRAAPDEAASPKEYGRILVVAQERDGEVAGERRDVAR